MRRVIIYAENIDSPNFQIAVYTTVENVAVFPIKQINVIVTYIQRIVLPALNASGIYELLRACFNRQPAK